MLSVWVIECEATLTLININFSLLLELSTNRQAVEFPQCHTAIRSRLFGHILLFSLTHTPQSQSSISPQIWRPHPPRPNLVKNNTAMVLASDRRNLGAPNLGAPTARSRPVVHAPNAQHVSDNPNHNHNHNHIHNHKP